MSFCMREMGGARRGFLRACEAIARHGANPRAPRRRDWMPQQRGRVAPIRHIETDRDRGRRAVTMVHGAEEVGKTLVGGMAAHARAISVKGESVEVLETPSQFYEVLMQGVRNARSRVVMASLYIGTGTLEQELLDVIAESLARKPALQVTILCDALRTTRPTQESDLYPSSAAMLSNILLSDEAAWRRRPRGDRAPDPLRVALYHTPALTRALKWLLPARVQEIVGVCHLKAFVFDDTVVMTGANLSTSYFTVRQDRYLCFPECKDLAAHFCSLVETVASYSYTLDGAGRLRAPRSGHPDPVAEPELFRTEMADSVRDLTLPAPGANVAGKGGDTWVFPTVQMGPLGIRQEEEAMLWLLKQLPPGADLHLSSPYFNLTPEYEDALLEAARDKHVQILTSSPRANGFYGSTGISGSIPLAYSLLEQSLYKRARSLQGERNAKHMGVRKKGLSIHEYERLGWTFHAKGLWCSLPGEEDGPSVSLLGSSNFGYRSRDRDLEAQLWLFTTAPRLRHQLERERDDLFVRAQRVNARLFKGPDRQGGPLAPLALHLVRPWL